MVHYPYWHDMVTRSEGSLGKLRQIWREERELYEEEALDDNPEIEEYRPVLIQELDLAKPADPAEQLHFAIFTLGADVTVQGNDGYALPQLFKMRP